MKGDMEYSECSNDDCYLMATYHTVLDK